MAEPAAANRIDPESVRPESVRPESVRPESVRPESGLRSFNRRARQPRGSSGS
jgi:hypothetical protein